MNCKQIPALILLFFSTVTGSAQTLDNKTINNAGGSTTTPTLIYEWSFGEPFTGEHRIGGYLWLTHGFLQPFAGLAVTAPNPLPLPDNHLLDGIDNAGSSVKVGNVLLEYTLGEWMTAARANGNYMLTQGILQPTLQPVVITLPVTGLDFQASRLNASYVQLHWRTLQESNNKGFTIERKLEQEPGFATIGFEESRAPGGNSMTPLDYSRIDTNSFRGRTYYRLRQEDLNGKISYSLICTVTGETGQTLILKAWPVPANSEVSVQAVGIEKDELLVFDASGKLLRQYPVANQNVIRISGMAAGTYYLRLKTWPELVQKIVFL